MTSDATPITHSFLADGGEMGALTRAFDWSKTALGSPDQWPLSLRTLISMLLQANSPMFLWWAPNLVQFYGELIYGNQQVEQIFRHPFRESHDIEAYKNWQLYDSLTGEPFPLEAMPMVRTLLHGETVVGVEMKRKRGDNTWGYASVNSVPVYDSEGRLLYGVAAFVDTTERKRAEEALRESDRRKDEFLATLAHELRNPLAPVSNTLQLLRLTASQDETIAPSVALMSRQINHLVRPRAGSCSQVKRHLFNIASRRVNR